MDDGYIPAAFLGAFCMWAYHAWHEPIAVKNYSDQAENAYVLTKQFSGQVAIIHGFVDDYSVCQMIKQRMERDGGYYGCVLASEISENP